MTADGSNAISARGIASCTKVSAASVLCGRARTARSSSLLTGRSSGFCVHPIEKKPLYHFLPGTPVLSFGTAGCNLGCRFCQNWDISKSIIDTLADHASPRMIAEAALALQCRSVAFTYNDPVIFHEYAIDVAAACRDRGIKTVAVTAGEVCTTALNFTFSWTPPMWTSRDLRRRFIAISRGHLQPVLETLIYLKRDACLAGVDNAAHPRSQRFGSGTRGLDVLGGRESTSRKCRSISRHSTRTTACATARRRLQETLRRAGQIAFKNGVRYAYVGNVHDPEADSTFCHACGNLLIGRDWYELEPAGTWKPLIGARVPDALFAGEFEPCPGNWGRKRLPVALESWRH